MAEFGLGNIGEAIMNPAEIAGTIPAELLPRFEMLVTIFQALGVAALIYLLFLIINIVLNIRSKLRIRKIHSIVEASDKKIDLLLKKQAEHNKKLAEQVDVINATLASELLKTERKSSFIKSFFTKKPNKPQNTKDKTTKTTQNTKKK